MDEAKRNFERKLLRGCRLPQDFTGTVTVNLSFKDGNITGGKRERGSEAFDLNAIRSKKP